MPLPSLYISSDQPRLWNVARAAACGGGIGVVAALLKTFGPFHAAASAPSRIAEIAAAAVAFALLCAGAAALRNAIARHFIWRS